MLSAFISVVIDNIILILKKMKKELNEKENVQQQDAGGQVNSQAVNNGEDVNKKTTVATVNDIVGEAVNQPPAEEQQREERRSALAAMLIQSTTEELWCRGFMYERINVHYPLWVAIVVNGVFFAFLHIFNPGVGVLPIVDIAVCGLSFSLAKWYTGSIWFPMGIHTAWNFTQNFLFGLPNSGLVLIP